MKTEEPAVKRTTDKRIDFSSVKPTCVHAFPQWKCMEMGCKAQYDELQQTIASYSKTSQENLTDEERRDVMNALYALQMYYPEPPNFRCE